MNRNKILVGCVLLSLSLELSGCASLTNPASQSKDSTTLTPNPLTTDESSSSPDGNSADSPTVPTITGALEITSEESRSEPAYDTTNDDVSTILIKDGGRLSLLASTITKTGSTSNNVYSNTYGLNSALLTKENSLLSLSKSTVSTNGTGSSGIFSYGKDATCELSEVTIHTEKENSKGIFATNGGIIRGNTVNVTTTDSNSPAVCTGPGAPSIDLDNSKLDTLGFNSPCIYSTGSMHINNSNGNSSQYNIAVLDGNSILNIENSNFHTSATGYMNGGVDSCGIMLYQSSSSSENEPGNLSLSNTTLSIDSTSLQYTKAPMFFATNGTFIMNLKNSTFHYGSSTLLSISGNENIWGNSESNGGNVILNATEQELNGDIIVDNISTLSMNFTKSKYKGSINADNTAKRIDIVLDKESTLTITSDSYITSIKNDDLDFKNIKTNGHVLYYDAKDSKNEWLGGITLTLSDGGILTPNSGALSTE